MNPANAIRAALGGIDPRYRPLRVTEADDGPSHVSPVASNDARQLDEDVRVAARCAGCGFMLDHKGGCVMCA